MIGSMNFPIVIGEMAMGDSAVKTRTMSSMSEDEFRLFYERTARPLWAYLSRLTGNSQKADDLLQETYYRFCRAAASHENEVHRRNSLFRIATNLVRDAARYQKYRAEVSLDEHTAEGSEPASKMPAPDRHFEVQSDLQRAMSRLDSSQRELLWLAYAQGASHAEIAAVLGVRAISVRTLLLRARKKLAALLEEGTRR